MTELVTTGRDALAEGLYHASDFMGEREANEVAGALIDSGVVRVLDPDDPELVERGARVVCEESGLAWETASAYAKESALRMSRAFIEALRQP